METMREMILICCLAANLPAQSGSHGTMLGSVTDDSGSPVGGALVTTNLQQADGVQTGPPFTASALADSNGQFELDELPAGTYSLCAEQESAAMLNPCMWSDQAITASVTAGGTTKGVSIAMQKGVAIKVRVDDPQQLLAKNGLADDILIGAGHGSSPFVGAQLVSKDANGKNLVLLIPADQTISMSVYSASFHLADAKGNGLTVAAANAVVPVKAPKGQNITVVIQVAGLAAATP